MIRQFARSTAIYSLGTLATRGVALLLVPIYTYHLVPAQYGLLETALVTIQLLLVLLSGGASQALIRFWYDRQTKPHRDQVIGAVLTIACALTFLAVVVTLLATAAKVPTRLGIPVELVWAVALAGAVRSVHGHLASVYRANERPGRYVVIHAVTGVLWVVSCYALVVVYHFGASGAIWSQVIAFGIVMGVTLPVVLREHGIGFDTTVFRQVAAFGAPLVLGMSAWFVLNAADRYFLVAYRNLTEVALYSLGARILSIHIMAVVIPLQLALGPLTFSLEASGSLPKKLGEVAVAYAAVLTFSACLVAMVARSVADVLAPPTYADAYRVLFWLLPSGVFLGMYYWGASLLHLTKKPGTIAKISAGAAVLNIGLNFVLIPRYGWRGAAVATDVAMFGAAAAVIAAGLHAQDVSLDRPRLALITALAVGLYAVAALTSSVSALPRYAIEAAAASIGMVALWRIALRDSAIGELIRARFPT